MAKYLDPKSDLTFKKVFGEHKDLLISFLNALLPLPLGKEVVEIEYLPSEMIPINPDKKHSIVDVRCTDTDKRQFLVEMQLYWTDAFQKRALLNTCKAYASPTERGMGYREIKPVYTICLVNDIAFPELEEFYHEFVPTHKQHSDVTIDDFEMIFIELPKFKPSSVKDKKMMVLWLRFLTEINERTRELPSDFTDNSLFSKALSILEESAYTDAELRAIDKYWDMVSCERTLLTASEDKGRAEGLAKGIAKGRAEGLAEGIAKEKASVAANLKNMGLPIEQIVKATGLTTEEIERL